MELIDGLLLYSHKQRRRFHLGLDLADLPNNLKGAFYLEHTVVAEREALIARNAIGLAEDEGLGTSLYRIGTLARLDDGRRSSGNGEKKSPNLHCRRDGGYNSVSKVKYLQFRRGQSENNKDQPNERKGK